MTVTTEITVHNDRAIGHQFKRSKVFYLKSPPLPLSLLSGEKTFAQIEFELSLEFDWEEEKKAKCSCKLQNPMLPPS